MALAGVPQTNEMI